MEFSAPTKKKFDELLTHYPNKRAALLPTLWLAQNEFGYLSQEAMEYVGGLLDLAPSHVYGVATFYTMFHLKPAGKYHVQLCRTLSCALMGSDEILTHLKKRLGIEEGEVTANGKFSLCTVECLASCGTAPAMMINEAYHENLDTKKVDIILDGLK